MPVAEFLLAAMVAVVAGLDRTAAFQTMVSRPIVVAPLTGWLLGDALIGLQVGFLVELLWLARLPVGAAIPPDDTQVAVGTTFLVIGVGGWLGQGGLPFLLLCTLVAIPLGKVGQYCDLGARHLNGRLLVRAEAALASGQWDRAERAHLFGLVHFALASLGAFTVIVAGGALVLIASSSLLVPRLSGMATWLQLMFPLVGTAVILGTVNVNRSRTLFAASFGSAFLMLWLL